MDELVNAVDVDKLVMCIEWRRVRTGGRDLVRRGVGVVGADRVFAVLKPAGMIPLLLGHGHSDNGQEEGDDGDALHLEQEKEGGS